MVSHQPPPGAVPPMLLLNVCVFHALTRSNVSLRSSVTEAPVSNKNEMGASPTFPPT
jgi:hypothetical protein